LTKLTPTQTCPNAIPDATGDFIFFGTSLPQKGGRVRARQAAAAKIRSCRSHSSSSTPGAKRNKYRNVTE
jgi:hypothetical protein